MICAIDCMHRTLCIVATSSVLLVSAALGGCNQEITQDSLVSRSPADSAKTWRLRPQELQGVVLTLSHIWITYRGASTDFSALRAPGWQMEAPPSRSRADALQLAQQIAERARRRPDEFEILARQYSEDDSTREFGGSLGTWSAALMFPEFIDELDVMRTGDVSNVVETESGFHILLRRRTPTAELVAADEIVIGYRGAPLLMQVRPGREISRSRNEAHAIANEVHARAAARPNEFPQFVEIYSDDANALSRGDIGTWSTHEPYIHHREIELIAQLDVGQVSLPIDSAKGFRIFRRKPASSTAKLVQLKTEIPRPTEPDVEFIVRNIDDPESLSSYVAGLKQVLRSMSPSLEEVKAVDAEKIFDRFAAGVRADDAEVRIAALGSFRAQMEKLLGTRYSELRTKMRQQVVSSLVPSQESTAFQQRRDPP